MGATYWTTVAYRDGSREMGVTIHTTLEACERDCARRARGHNPDNIVAYKAVFVSPTNHQSTLTTFPVARDEAVTA